MQLKVIAPTIPDIGGINITKKRRWQIQGQIWDDWHWRKGGGDTSENSKLLYICIVSTVPVQGRTVHVKLKYFSCTMRTLGRIKLSNLPWRAEINETKDQCVVTKRSKTCVAFDYVVLILRFFLEPHGLQLVSPSGQCSFCVLTCSMLNCALAAIHPK
jgi:hypothetical protein